MPRCGGMPGRDHGPWGAPAFQPGLASRRAPVLSGARGGFAPPAGPGARGEIPATREPCHFPVHHGSLGKKDLSYSERTVVPASRTLTRGRRRSSKLVSIGTGVVRDGTHERTTAACNRGDWPAIGLAGDSPRAGCRDRDNGSVSRSRLGPSRPAGRGSVAGLRAMRRPGDRVCCCLRNCVVCDRGGDRRSRAYRPGQLPIRHGDCRGRSRGLRLGDTQPPGTSSYPHQRPGSARYSTAASSRIRRCGFCRSLSVGDKAGIGRR
jgi:hypothetical protein